VEGRKLQLAGGSTYLVSLPKRWVLDAGLKAGDTLFVDSEADGSVSVRRTSGERLPVRRKVFEERGEQARDHLLRKLIGAYISGYGLIEVHFEAARGPFVRHTARDFCRLVIGPEVIEESGDALVIQDLSDPSELSAEKCLRRMHLITRAMLEDSVLALQSRNPSLARDVAQRSQDVERLYWMVAKRYLSSGPTRSGPDGPARGSVLIYGLAAKLLERIAFHGVRIAGTYDVLSEKRSIDPKLAANLMGAKDSALAIVDHAFHALMAADVDEANEAIDSRHPHQKLIDELFHRVATRKGAELLALGSVLDSLGRIAGWGSDLAEQAINLAVMTEPSPAVPCRSP
jgi:phosphate uptake regulator